MLFTAGCGRATDSYTAKEKPNSAPIIRQIITDPVTSNGLVWHCAPSTSPGDLARIKFRAEVTDPDDPADSLKWYWDFGDGVTSDMVATVETGWLEHEFPYVNENGFIFSLVVEDPHGNKSYMDSTHPNSYPEDINKVYVMNGSAQGNRKPVISALNADQISVSRDQTISFTATATDADSDPLTYYWSFSDGTQKSGVDLTTVTHNYTEQGLYLVKLMVEDDYGTKYSLPYGARDFKNIAIGVETNIPPLIEDLSWDYTGMADGNRPTANDEYTLSKGHIPTPIDFSCTATDPDGEDSSLHYKWEFRYDPYLVRDPQMDGINLTTVDDLYYPRGGQWIIKVTVTDSMGDSTSIQKWIDVFGEFDS